MMATISPMLPIIIPLRYCTPRNYCTSFWLP